MHTNLLVIFGSILGLCVVLSSGQESNGRNWTTSQPHYRLVKGVGYYRMYKESTTWYDAWKTCKDDGAHLAIINSAEEEKVIRDIVVEGSNPFYIVFVGAHDLFYAGEYVTIFGQSLGETGFSKWGPGEPDFSSGHCVFYKLGYRGYGNTVCNAKWPFICEHEVK